MSGFDKLQRQLKEAQRAFAALDGDLTTVRFDPEDPGSIEAAVQQVNDVIDERVGQYAKNLFVAPLIGQAKEQYRQAILDKAEAARLGDTDRIADEGDEAGEDA